MIVTKEDRAAAHEAIVNGWDKCGNQPGRGCVCGCDLSVIDGCKAQIEAVAEAIANARSPNKALQCIVIAAFCTLVCSALFPFIAKLIVTGHP